MQMTTVHTVAYSTLAGDDVGQVSQATQVFAKKAEAEEFMKLVCQDIATFWKVPLVQQVVEVKAVGRFIRLWEIEPAGPKSQPTLLRLLAQIRHDEVQYASSTLIIPTGIRK